MYIDSTSSPRADNYLIAELFSYRRDVRNAGNMNLLPIPTPLPPVPNFFYLVSKYWASTTVQIRPRYFEYDRGQNRHGFWPLEACGLVEEMGEKVHR